MKMGWTKSIVRKTQGVLFCIFFGPVVHAADLPMKKSQVWEIKNVEGEVENSGRGYGKTPLSTRGNLSRNVARNLGEVSILAQDVGKSSRLRRLKRSRGKRRAKSVTFEEDSERIDELFSEDSSQEPVLVLYELYYSRQAWSHVHLLPPYRGMCVYPGMVRNGSHDVDAPELLPVLKDLTYQGLLCEYGAMFTLDKHLDEIHGKVPFLGFQSWRAKKKGFHLRPTALKRLMSHMRAEVVKAKEEGGKLDTRVFYYWSTWKRSHMYRECRKEHGSCHIVYSAAFHALFGTQSKLDDENHATKYRRSWLPPLPTIEREYSYCSYWVMHRDHFRKFIAFARAFFVTLESLWRLHGDVERCPLSFRKFRGFQYNSRLCWCFIMERVVNIWVYHSSTKMIWIDSKTGYMEEQHPLKDRRMWSLRFADNETIPVLKSLLQRIPKESVTLYQDLGGELPTQQVYH